MNIEDIKKFADDNNTSMHDLYLMTKNYNDKLHQLAAINEAKDHSDFIGKCYKDDSWYYKVISVRAFAPTAVTCITIPVDPEPEFIDQVMTSCSLTDMYFGRFAMKTIDLDGIYLTDLEQLLSITDEEFNEAARRFVDNVLSVDWRKLDYDPKSV